MVSSSAIIARSVVTFYHDDVVNGSGDNDYCRRIIEEVDLQDYEVLVDTYKFLARNNRKNNQRKNNQRSLRSTGRPNNLCRDDSDGSASSFACIVVSDRHKQAIMTLVDIDKVTKRVVRILPEFFPENTKVLPSCLSSLECLKSLNLDHCKELTCLPAGLLLHGLEELRIDVSSFQEPFPTTFGNLRNLKTLIIRGNCTELDCSNIASTNDAQQEDKTEILLFPPSMVRLTNLRYLETHIQNLLHIPPKVLDSWSSSLETLVVTQDLSSSSTTTSTSKNNDIGAFLQRGRGYSTDSSDDDFNLLYLDDEESDDEEDGGFSLLKHNDLFREALRNQLEVRAFRSIAQFKSLRSLKLIFDDSKYRKDFTSIRNRLRNKRRNNNENVMEVPYSVPLSLLAGPLSLSLKELDIGTYVASTTSSSSKKKSKIPIEISWVDILQDFPLLERLRLQECRCSFSNKTSAVDLTASAIIEDEELLLTELRHLVLDRCLDFALMKTSVAEPSSDDIGIFDGVDDDGDGDDDGSEDIVFYPLNDGDGDALSLEDINDDDLDTMIEDAEEISQITRLSSLLEDTVLSPLEFTNNDEDETNCSDEKKLSILCTKLLRRCPKLEFLSIRDCGIASFCNELLSCLPKDHLKEMTLDANYDDGDYVVKKNLWAVFDAYPSLVSMQGTYMNGLSKTESDKLYRRLIQRQQKDYDRSQRSSSPLSWIYFWDKKQQHQQDNLPTKNTENNLRDDSISSTIKVVSSVEKEHRIPSPPSAFQLPWPVKALERKLSALNSSKGGAGVLRSIKRSNSRDML